MKLHPKRDLAGATPESLARALLRPLRPVKRQHKSPTKGKRGSNAKPVK